VGGEGEGEVPNMQRDVGRKLEPVTVTGVRPRVPPVEGDTDRMVKATVDVKAGPSPATVRGEPLEVRVKVAAPGTRVGEVQTKVPLDRTVAGTELAKSPKEQANPDRSRKPPPVTVTTVPPVSGPAEGEREATVTFGEKVKGEEVPEKSCPLTETVRGRVVGSSEGGETQVRRVVETKTAGEVAKEVTNPNPQVRVEEGTKFRPWTVIVVPPAVGPWEGYAAVTVTVEW